MAINPSAAQSRESARRADGRFGEQEHRNSAAGMNMGVHPGERRNVVTLSGAQLKRIPEPFRRDYYDLGDPRHRAALALFFPEGPQGAKLSNEEKAARQRTASRRLAALAPQHWEQAFGRPSKKTSSVVMDRVRSLTDQATEANERVGRSVLESNSWDVSSSDDDVAKAKFALAQRWKEFARRVATAENDLGHPDPSVRRAAQEFVVASSDTMAGEGDKESAVAAWKKYRLEKLRLSGRESVNRR